MTYSLFISEKVDKIFSKLDKRLLEMISKKISNIVENPHRFKPLRGSRHGEYRVHIDRSFVLVYEIIEDELQVKILDFTHHDNAY